ncbi:MAG: NotI family restriction endonuclease [Candidatus Hinthialibacter antarcticus]|nr:NotI family restriction endonuclease [Candidatus Hinthialibacter antarcticus]
MNPLSEVFGFPPSDCSPKAIRYRKNKLCPYNNIIPNCTKDKANDPLGVCSINHEGAPVITCPVRFREDWLITDDAADFFFPDCTDWTSLTEVRLVDYYEKSAGNIDVVLAAYNSDGHVYDFCSLEIQAVYISGNIRDPFKAYMADYKNQSNFDWSGQPKYPRPDYLSSSRKRLAPQLLFKGGILHAWNKKMAVALNKGFFETLPTLKPVSKEEAEIAWLIYDLEPDQTKLILKKVDIIYTKFKNALDSITKSKPGNIDAFMNILQNKVDKKLETPPVNKTIENPIESE